MSTPAPQVTTRPRPTGGANRASAVPTAVLAVVLAVVLGALLIGCGADGEPQGPSTAPTGSPRSTDAITPPATREVPVRNADLSGHVVPAVVPPTEVAIPSLDVTLPVEPVGVQADGQMEIPPLAEVGGWYRYGASPAEDAGTSVIAAHVDSAASGGAGPFARLGDVAVGDPVVVTTADGVTHAFTVTEVRRTPKPVVEWADVFVRDGNRRLVLVTCGGTFDRAARSYSDNVIVTAEPEAA